MPTLVGTWTRHQWVSVGRFESKSITFESTVDRPLAMFSWQPRFNVATVLALDCRTGCNSSGALPLCQENTSRYLSLE